MDVEIDVPPFFLCPISLSIMRDPVTVSTGITYDRESIEKWLFSWKNQTCPVTKQKISDSDLTPNHTLRRLLQAWCTANASLGVERIPTPKPPVSRSEIAKLIAESRRSPNSTADSLRRLRSIAAESEANRRIIESSNAAGFLFSLIISGSDSAAGEEALSVLHVLKLSESAIRSGMAEIESELVKALARVMLSGDMESGARAVALLKSIFESEALSMSETMSLDHDMFAALVNFVKDGPASAAKAALQVLIASMPHGRNRVKAVEAGAVPALVEALLESPERRRSEMVLSAMDIACGCADGRAALLMHAAGLAAVSKKVLRVSSAASDRAIRVLLSVARHSASPSVVAEMASIGVVAKMCLVLQVDCDPKTKEKAAQILRIHARAWRNSPCVPKHLMSSYPN